jgi:hypothetical protein
MECRIERSFLHTQQLIGGFLDMKRDPVTMQLGHMRESFENQKIKSSLKDVLRHANP